MAQTQRISLVISLVTVISMTFSFSATVRAEVIEVILDQAKVLQLPPNTATVILGNPTFADVTVLKRNNQMILTGKAFGQTNMIALDPDGNSIGESTIRVSGATHGLVVQRGLQRETYSCAPRCQPTLSLGDHSGFFAPIISQMSGRQGATRTR